MLHAVQDYSSVETCSVATRMNNIYTFVAVYIECLLRFTSVIQPEAFQSNVFKKRKLLLDLNTNGQ